MKKCLLIALLAVILLAVGSMMVGCLDLTNTNNDQEYGARPEAGTPEFAEIDTNADGLISDEEWAHWVVLNQ